MVAARSPTATRMRTSHERKLKLREWEQRMLGPDSPVRERWQRLMEHRDAELILGAGVLGLLSVVAIPPRGWAALGGGLFGATAWLVRAPVGAVIIGVLLAKVWSDPSIVDTTTNRQASDIEA